MTNLQWCCETNLFATEALAEILDVELPTVEMPEPRRVARHAGARAPRRATSRDDRNRRRVPALQAAHDVPHSRATSRGPTRSATRVSEDDLDDLHQLLGHRPESWLEGEAELERFVLADADTGRHDEALVQVFHKRNLRAQMLLGPAGSAMARHLTIQTFLS